MIPKNSANQLNIAALFWLLLLNYLDCYYLYTQTQLIH